MSIVYQLSIKDKKLKSVSSVKHFIETEDFKVIFKLEQLDSLVPAEIERLKSEYKGYDVYYDSYKKYSDIHFHEGKETRIILKGSATFYIPIQEDLYIVHCEPLDKIIINSNVLHWFSSDEPLTVLRLFSNSENHVEHKLENIPQEVNDIHSMLKFGFVFDV